MQWHLDGSGTRRTTPTMSTALVVSSSDACCRRPALFQALSLEVYATVRLGRASLLGRSHSTDRICR